MNLSKFNLIIGVSTLMISSASYADVIPYGIQTNVSDAQIVDWGWSECHRSTSNAGVAESTVTNNCAGGYLARGIWDESRGEYGVIGVGLYDVVTDQTYTDFHGDDTGTVQNWSNGLNWYRTVISGSWGFTTSGQTALNTADVNLQNGLNSYDTVGTIETDLAAGLTFHTNGVTSRLATHTTLTVTRSHVLRMKTSVYFGRSTRSPRPQLSGYLVQA